MKDLEQKTERAELKVRNEFCQSLLGLGIDTEQYSTGANFREPHPKEHCLKTEPSQKIEIVFDCQDCYFRAGNHYLGYWHLDVITYDRHHHDFDCESMCDTKWVIVDERPAEPDEIEHLVRKQVEKKEQELNWRLEIAANLKAVTIPMEDIKKIRRRVEDRLRKDPALSLAVAKALNI